MTKDNLIEETIEKADMQTSSAPAIPEKFLDKETGEIRLDALMKSYLALEQKLSNIKSAKDTTNAPLSLDEYQIELKSDMLMLDEDVNKRLLDKGFTNAQAQEVYDIAADKLVPMIAGMMMDVQADRELERIVTKFGGAEKWTKVAKQLLNFGQKNLDAKTLDTLASSYEGVMRLYDMMLAARQSAGFDKIGKSGGLTIDEQTLTKMMRDPRYWKDKDPNFIAKVTEGFQDIYS